MDPFMNRANLRVRIHTVQDRIHTDSSTGEQRLLHAAQQPPSRWTFERARELAKLVAERSDNDVDLACETFPVFVAHFQNPLPPADSTFETRIWSEDIIGLSLQIIVSNMSASVRGSERLGALDVPACKDLLISSLDNIYRWMEYLVQKCLNNPDQQRAAVLLPAVLDGLAIFGDSDFIVPCAIDVLLPLWIINARSEAVKKMVRQAQGPTCDANGSLHLSMNFVLSKARMSSLEPAPNPVARKLLPAADDIIVTILRYLETGVRTRPIPWREMSQCLQMLGALLSNAGFSSHSSLISPKMLSQITRLYVLLVHEEIPPGRDPAATLRLTRSNVHISTWCLEHTLRRPTRARSLPYIIKAGLLSAMIQSSRWMSDQERAFALLDSSVGRVEDRLQFFNDCIVTHMALYPVFDAVFAQRELIEDAYNHFDIHVISTLQQWSSAFVATRDREQVQRVKDRSMCHN
jgi:hypothetical protein